mmetsp:Transcript_33635/g.71159  ORF Transcript_33635/g.71159 Transcript_33635/m.71159 type:complete len:346 (+) Transcript_33635:39-1076(+)|eukprot:CAMPEP_0204319634 /NCGR_PEP_ID=MMETSP0469-20131031/7208_1 /ASSEMBLY_ACC=CAM_ASM_000384 /TAXON_ID=2969 /ORGANISM="Oxyrrhis marina" /LENGTH=345 /DNA_ID=CAMNT_0051300829 /DNA_START=13 /DNA_END=1050 /DNA_ORIENTATION=-
MESESDGEDARVQREREEAALCLTYEQRLVNPLEIRFSQPVVRPSFSDKNAVQEAVDTTHLEDGSTEFDGVLRPPFPSIRIIAWRPRLRIAGRMYMAEQQLYTLDNRRLYALQLAAMQHWPKRVGVMVGVAPRLPGQSHARKFRNPTAGVEVDVGHNFSSPDRTWCWRNVAMDVERNGFFVASSWILAGAICMPLIIYRANIHYRFLPGSGAPQLLLCLAVNIVLGVAQPRVLAAGGEYILQRHVEAMAHGRFYWFPRRVTVAQLGLCAWVVCALLLPYVRLLTFTWKLGASILRVSLTAACFLGAYHTFQVYQDSQLRQAEVAEALRRRAKPNKTPPSVPSPGI